MSSRALALSLVLPALALSAVGAAPGASAATGPTCHGVRATIVGTAGADRLVGTSGRDVIVGRGGNDRIAGRRGDDLVCGGAGADRLLGGAGDDRLHGGHAQRVHHRFGDEVRGDTIVGGAGNDVLDAGIEYGRRAMVSRPDTVTFADAVAPVRIDLAGAVATGEGEDVLVAGDGLRVIGSDHDDEMLGSSRRETLSGGLGDDMLGGRGSGDQLDGGRGDDAVTGGAGADLVVGMSGLDELAGNGGTDVIVSASRRAATVLGGDGRDLVLRRLAPGAAGLVDGGAGANEVLLIEGHLLGPDADESATPGSVVVDRAAGTAVASGEVASTLDVVGFSSFTLAGRSDWTYRGTDGRDVVSVILGPLHAATLGGDDLLLGDEGDDVLDGGAGTDRAFGGEGRNTCVDVEKGDCDGHPADLLLRAARATGAPSALAGLPGDVRGVLAGHLPGLR